MYVKCNFSTILTFLFYSYFTGHTQLTWVMGSPHQNFEVFEVEKHENTVLFLSLT